VRLGSTAALAAFPFKQSEYSAANPEGVSDEGGRGISINEASQSDRSS